MFNRLPRFSACLAFACANVNGLLGMKPNTSDEVKEMFKKAICGAIFAGSVLAISGCTTESVRTITPAKVTAADIVYQGPRSTIVVGQFDNRSNYLRGVFSNGSDPLGSQAKTLLLTHLQQTGYFNVLDRANMNEAAQESKIRGQQRQLKGAAYLVSGDVTAFGRKQVGDKQLFGILGRGKSQVAYAKVSLGLIDVNTSQVLYTAQGAGEYALSNREILGTGGTASYDSTLNGKVLDLAIREAVDGLVVGFKSGAVSAAQ